MPTITLERIKGRDVAKRLSRELKLDPELTYTITVHAEDAELAGAESLEKVMDIVGARAKVRGLDSEILEKILNDG